MYFDIFLTVGVFGCPTTVANVETVAVAPVNLRESFAFVFLSSYLTQLQNIIK